ncbi:MAG: cupredoxin domain-containing protein [Nocardioidaceae bacterium]
MRINTSIIVVTAVTAILGLSACSSSVKSAGSDAHSDATSQTPGDSSRAAPSSKSSRPGSATASTGDAAQEAVITIKNYAFAGPDSVSGGATITVKNEDSVAHTVTGDDDGTFDVNVPPGVTATFMAPDKPGSYPFHCSYHSDMTATLTVT